MKTLTRIRKWIDGSTLRPLSSPGTASTAANTGVTPSEYWTEVNVTAHHQFRSADESLAYFHWRNAQYFPYINYLPVSGQDGKVVLDYGCGPGHDVIGFAGYSKPSRLIAMDVSPTSLAEARGRLALHGARADFMLINEQDARLPLDDESVDYIHSSGVLHHVPDPVAVLRELRRVLKRGGEMRVMVYNYDSVFLHLYVAYLTQIEAGLYADDPVREAFRHLTDGEHCPISNVYKPSEYIALVKEAGFTGDLIGCAISMYEASLLPRRFDAIQDRRLPAEHRDFLLNMRFDQTGMPMHGSAYAGVDACYRFRRT